MASFLRHELPKDYKLILTGDWHCGAVGFDEEAALHITGRLLDEADTFGVFMGDAVEGKLALSKHFNPDGLQKHRLTAGKQFDYWGDLMHDTAPKWLACIPGNHDVYLDPDDDLMARVCREHGLPYGDYQTWLDLGDVRGHLWHGFPTMPKGAKDPIQREGNQKSWLKRSLEELGAASAHFQAMGHTHYMMIVPPLEKYALLDGGPNVKARAYVQPEGTVDGMPYVPPDAKWYFNTGTLSRSGGFGHRRYSEVKGYRPQPLGYIEMTVCNGVIESARKVIV